MKTYRIFVINPGSTSTKLALYENKKELTSANIFHDSSVMLKFPSINDQLPYRMEMIWNFLEENDIDLRGIDAIVGRGGGCYSLVSGTYEIDDRMIEDTVHPKSGLQHASNLGVQMVNEVHKKYGGRMFTVDPPVVDEFIPVARVSGYTGVYRKSHTHALSLKATAMTHAKHTGRKYKDCNFIVCHIDGGISISAHRKGKMIDAINASGGEGPFTPTRSGSMALTNIMEDHLQVKDLKLMTTEAGGFSSYFGTSDSGRIHRLVEEGDPKAKLIWDAMIYQISKNIGGMSTVLGGKVDDILLTGGLMRFKDIEDGIRERCGFIAPVTSYPGEFEMDALDRGALRVLTGEEKPKHYSGKPVWDGFHFDPDQNKNRIRL